MNIFSKLTIKTLKQNRVRTLVTIIGVILSTAMLTAVTTILSSVQNYLKEAVIEEEGSWQMVYPMMTQEKIQKVIEDPQVLQSAAVQLQGYAKTQEDTFGRSYFCFLGFSEEAYSMLNPKLKAGRFPENENEIAIPYTMVLNTEKEYKIGQSITVSVGKRMDGGELGQFDKKTETEEIIDTIEKTVTIVGIYETLGTENGFMLSYTFITSQIDDRTLPMDLYLTVHQPRKIFSFAETIAQTIPLERKAVFHNILLRYQGAVDNGNFYHVIFGLVAVILLLIVGGAVVLIYNAFSISVSERTKQFGLLSSVGATKRQLRKMIQMEAGMISLIGIPIGVISGIIGIGITLHFIGEGLEVIVSNGNKTISLSISWISILAAVLLSVLTVLLSAWIPAIRSGKVSPMEAIRQTKDIKIPKKKIKTSKFLYCLIGFKGVLAVKNYKRSKRKYKSVIMSLVLSMVLFISASSLITYLGRSTRFVLKVPEGDIYFNVYNHNTSEEEKDADYLKLKKCMNEVLNQGIAQEGRIVKKIFLEITVPSELFIDSTYKQLLETERIEEGKAYMTFHFYIMEDQDFAEFMRSQKLEAEPYLSTEQGRAVLFDEESYIDTEDKKYKQRKMLNTYNNLAVSFSKAFIEQKNPELIQKGDSSELEQGAEIWLGDVISKLPMGTDIGNGSYSLVLLMPKIQFETFLKPWLEQSNLLKETSETDLIRLAFQVTDDKTAYQEIERCFLENGVVNRRDGFLYNAAEEVRGDRSTLMAIRVLSYGFIILITLIAIVNVFHTISTNVSLRKREFAMLCSVGMTKKDLKKITGYECLFCIGRSILYGIPLSVFMNWLIYRQISRGAEIPLLLPIKPTLTAVFGIVVILFFTMWYSIRKLKKENIIDTLKNETI